MKKTILVLVLVLLLTLLPTMALASISLQTGIGHITGFGSGYGLVDGYLQAPGRLVEPVSLVGQGNCAVDGTVVSILLPVGSHIGGDVTIDDVLQVVNVNYSRSEGSLGDLDGQLIRTDVKNFAAGVYPVLIENDAFTFSGELLINTDRTVQWISGDFSYVFPIQPVRILD